MSKVQVAVRCRPKLPHEQNVPANKIECNEVSNTISVTGATTAGTQGGTTKTFTFDKVIPENATQEDIFEYVSPMVDHALDGLHSTVFAYGQTGSGKTFTMEGYDYAPTQNNKLQPREDTPPAQHGIVPRLIQLAFDRARERMGGRATADEADEYGLDSNEDGANDSDTRYKLKCSFVQLYNERVTDLLNPSSNSRNKEGLRLRWTRNDQFVVENLYTFECDNATQMRDMFLTGVKEKVMGSHHMNVQSSRSHCLFTIHVHSWNTHNPELVRKAELTLVDLAGSEKLALLSQNPSAQLLKESIEINTSLLALGKVITALAARSTGKAGSKSSATHIPYRDSKLTKLLKHALGGNSMTIMIACINPLDPYVEESVSTLLYAGRARNITNEPTVNDDPRSALIRSLRDEITTLKTELEYYRQLVVNGVVDDKLAAQLTENLEKANRDTKQQRAIVGPSSTTPGDASATNGDGNDDAQSTKEVELAEKLIESCKILKNLMGVNGQLRDAFDKLKVSKEKLEQREVSVNAENTALRERIEMLESIALQEGSADESDASDDEHDTASNKKASSYTRKRSDKGVTSTKTANSVPKDVTNQSAVNTRTSSDVNRPQQPAPPTSRPQSSSGRSSPPPPEVLTTQTNAPKRSDASAPPPVAPRRSTSTHSDKTTAPPPKRKAAGPASNGASRGKGFYQNQLQAYANKYRNPTKAPSYEDYYGRSSVKNPLGGTGGRYENPARQMETMSNPNAQQLAITKKSQEVAALLNKLSRNLPESTVALIPSSLQGEHNFGSLGFGGTGAERDELEEKRRQREERLRHLREQNQSLGTKSYFDGPTSGGGMASSTGGGGRGYISGGGGGSGLNLANTYSGAHDDALANHNYYSTYHQQQQQQPPTFGGLSPNPQRGRRSTQPIHASVASTNSVGSATGKLFQYLSQEETETAFSADQLEKLKRRSGGGASSSGGAPVGSGGTFPRSSSTDPMPVGSRPVSATITPRNNSAPNSPAPTSNTPQHPKKQHHALGTNRIGGGVPQPMSMIPSAYASSTSKTVGSGTHGSSSSVVSNSPMSQASSNGGGSGTRGRRGNGPHVVAAASSTTSTYQRDPTKGTPTYSSPSTTTPAGPSYIARLSEAVGLSTLAPSGGNLTPRTKSSYDMGVYNMNTTPPHHQQQGGRVPSQYSNQQQPPPRVAAHDVMRRRGEEISEQQRYQQQMYEAQKALMDQQSKMNPRR